MQQYFYSSKTSNQQTPAHIYINIYTYTRIHLYTYFRMHLCISRTLHVSRVTFSKHSINLLKVFCINKCLVHTVYIIKFAAIKQKNKFIFNSTNIPWTYFVVLYVNISIYRFSKIIIKRARFQFRQQGSISFNMYIKNMCVSVKNLI